MKKIWRRYLISVSAILVLLALVGVKGKLEVSASDVYDKGEYPITMASPMDNVTVYVDTEGFRLTKDMRNATEKSVGYIQKKGEEIEINSETETSFLHIVGVAPMSQNFHRAHRILYGITLERSKVFLNSYLMESEHILPKGTKLDYLELYYEGEKGYGKAIYEFKTLVDFDTKVIVPDSASRLYASWFDEDGNWQEKEIKLTPIRSEKAKWVKKENTWYYYDSMEMKTRNKWIFYGNQWYYLGKDGKMQTGWFQDKDGRWYYLRTKSNVPQKGSEGAMCKGWIKIAQYWYYLRPEGNVPYGGPSGSMLQNTSAVIGNKTYYFDGSGHCINP